MGQTYYKRMEKTLRQAGKTSERYGEKIMCLMRASTYWKKNHETKIADLINKRKEGDKLIKPLQCEKATPVMAGADVSTEASLLSGSTERCSEVNTGDNHQPITVSLTLIIHQPITVSVTL